MENAANADGVVQGKLELHRRGIEMLSRSEEELEAAIPSASQSAADNSHSPSAAQLRLLMNRVFFSFNQFFKDNISLFLKHKSIFGHF